MDDDACWQAVSARDPSSDDLFVYGVMTTGVYCRPSCPARRPRRENVRFFPSPADARQAGLRPCKRCTPDGPGDAERRAELVARACRVVDDAVAEGRELPALDELAVHVGMSPHHFHRVFRAETGITPKAYADARRAERVRSALHDQAPVTDAIYAAGFASSSRFYASAAARLGMTPTQFRSGGKGVDVRFAVASCSLGAVLVAATERGVCAIELGDDPDELVRLFQDRFHAARLYGGDERFEALVAQVAAVVEGTSSGHDLPLDIRGTAFQQRVWQALRDIPAGTTVTYTQLAERIGAPRSVRAVARACATNAIAVAIPCHRVVRTDGSLAGYRWGIERKRALLARESTSAS